MSAIIEWFRAHPEAMLIAGGGLFLTFFSRSIIWLLLLAAGVLLYVAGFQ